jgi:hypothetical protein
VFVGRMEVVTPGIERSATTAVAENDSAVLARFGRFLGPIADRIVAKHPDAATRVRVRSATDAAYASLLRRASTCD